jgi:hypothetical protein
MLQIKIRLSLNRLLLFSGDAADHLRVQQSCTPYETGTTRIVAVG